MARLIGNIIDRLARGTRVVSERSMGGGAGELAILGLLPRDSVSASHPLFAREVRIARESRPEDREATILFLM
jgi:hypothetical protein